MKKKIIYTVNFLILILLQTAIPQTNKQLKEIVIQKMSAAAHALVSLSAQTSYNDSNHTYRGYNGGYAGIYKLNPAASDFPIRWGEDFYEYVEGKHVFIQNPGTPAVGMAFLRAYNLNRDSSWFCERALDVGRALAFSQTLSGGWNHQGTSEIWTLGTDPVPSQDVNIYNSEKDDFDACLDDDVSQGALQFLIQLDTTVNKSGLNYPWLRQAVISGLNFILNAQYPNGAWPQWFPLQGSKHDHSPGWYNDLYNEHESYDAYNDYYTFNDNVAGDCIKALILSYKVFNTITEYKNNTNYNSMRNRIIESIRLAGQYIKRAQLSEAQNIPNAGWAEQYLPGDIKSLNDVGVPAWGRIFEPPVMSTTATVNNILTLIDIAMFFNDPTYIAPIQAAVSWLNSVKKDDRGLRARYYQINNHMQEIYAWNPNQYTLYTSLDTNSQVAAFCKNYYVWWRECCDQKAIQEGIEFSELAVSGYMNAHNNLGIGIKLHMSGLRTKTKQTIKSLDNTSALWLTHNPPTTEGYNFGDFVFITVFCDKFNLLCDYLEAYNKRPSIMRGVNYGIKTVLE